MANKLNQISIGDAFLYELDDNPRTTGFGASVGSIAFYQGNLGLGIPAKFFFKSYSNNFGWQELQWAFQYQGNTFSGLAGDALLGSVSGADKDMQLIRNGIQLMRLAKATNTYGLDEPSISFFQDKMFLMRHSVLDTSFNNYNSILTNWNLPYDPSITKWESITIASQAQTNTYGNRGVSRGTIHTDKALTVYEYGNGLRNQVYAGPYVEIPLDNMEYQNPLMIKVTLDVIARDQGTGMVFQRTKTFTLKSTNYASGQYSVLFNQDEFSYSEDGVYFVDVDLVVSNETDTTNGAYPANTYKLTARVSGLIPANTFDIGVYSKRIAFEI